MADRSLLQLLQAERDEYCKFEDYSGYHRHLTNKLHSSRKAVKRQSGGAGDAKKAGIADTHTQKRLLLYNAERSWATAMHNKATSGKRAQDVLNKLRRAKKWSQDIRSAVGAEAGDVERVEAIAYAEYMEASLAQERGAYEAATRHYSRALLALRDSCSALLEGIETGLRFSLYQTGTEGRSVELRVLSATQLKEDDDPAAKELLELLKRLDPARLDTGDDVASGGDEMVTKVEWAGRTAPLQHTELASSISSIVSARKHLTHQPTGDVKIEDYDSLLAEWTKAEALLNNLIADEEDQDRSQTLEITRAWTRFNQATDRVARDKLLASEAKTAREAALIWESIRTTLAQAQKLPGVSKEQKSDLNEQISAAQGERLAALAKPWGDSLEAIALLHTALQRHFATPSARRTALQRQLAKTVARNAISGTTTSAASADGQHFSERYHPQKFYNGNVKQLVAKRSTRDASKRTAAHALVTDSVAMRPVVFDVAFNYLSRDLSGGSAKQSAAVPAAVAKPVEAVERVVEEVKDTVMSDAPSSSGSAADSQADTPKKSGGLFGFFGRK